MARRGPTPKPTALKIAEETRSDRVNRSEPVPRSLSRVPGPPDHLSKEACKVWRQRAGDLHDAGVLTPLDLDVFATYCELEVEERRARAILSAGLLKRGRYDQGMVTNPVWRIYRDTVKLKLDYARELGLTPSARSRISLPDRASDAS